MPTIADIRDVMVPAILEAQDGGRKEQVAQQWLMVADILERLEDLAAATPAAPDLSTLESAVAALVTAVGDLQASLEASQATFLSSFETKMDALILQTQINL